MDSADLIQRLELTPHPEGGWYREIHRSSLKVTAPGGPRTALTSIYYLLRAQQVSRWHTVDADEIWHFFEGAPLELFCYQPGTRQLRIHTLTAPDSGGLPVAVIPAGAWQAARSLGEHSLMGCTVGPGFEFADFRFVSTLPAYAAHFVGDMQRLRALL